MTWLGEKYPLRQMLAGTGTASLVLTRYTTVREDPMNRTVAPADTAHRDARLAELSTLLASQDRSNGPCARACDGRRSR